MLNTKKVLLMSLAALILQGCGPKTFTVKNSTLETEAYTTSTSSSDINDIAFKSSKTAAHKPFSNGKLAINLHIDGAPVEPVAYLRNNVIKELNSKGVDINDHVNSETILNIEQFYLRNHRTNGYTPFITFGNFKGDLIYANETYPISAFVKRGKVPVWSFNEVIEPTLNEPLALISKEVAAKINRVVFKRQISDAQVDALVADIEANAEDKKSFLKVYELGFGNNNRAIKSLTAFSRYDEEYIRLAAISSLGILQDESQIDYLWSIFETGSSWQDRAMALKALGDINTAASRTKLLQAKPIINQDKERAINWFNEILELYL